MSWRERFTIHPACALFPMMSDEELKTLGEDIATNGLQSPIICQDGDELVLLDGRNRLAALELVGLYDGHVDTVFVKGDPVSAIISANIRRRHLGKQQQAEMIIAAHRISRHVGEVSAEPHKGGRGKVNQVKAAAVATAKAMPDGPSKRTIERELGRATEHPYSPGSAYEKQEKAAKKRAARKKRRATLQEYSQQLARLPKNLDGARWYYLQFVAKPGVDLNSEMTLIVDAIQNLVDREKVSA